MGYFRNLFNSVVNGLVPASGGGTSNFLRADGSWYGDEGLRWNARGGNDARHKNRDGI